MLPFFQMGSLNLSTYIVVIIASFIIASFIASTKAKLFALKPLVCIQLTIVAFVGAVVGAKMLIQRT